MKYPSKRITNLTELLPYEETLVSLIETHRTLEQIMSILFCPLEVLNEYAFSKYGVSFDDLHSSISERSNHQLISKEYEVAYDGNAKMLQFLGKNYAKQTDDASLQATLQENIVIVDDFSSKAPPQNTYEDTIK